MEGFCVSSQKISGMEELKEIYDRMTSLRQKGIKMKMMAEKAGFSPSVLSAIYSTVLPAYFKNKEEGQEEDEALNNALVWVNNVSKKKLLGSLANLKNSLFAMDAAPKAIPEEEVQNPFLSQLEERMRDTMNHITNYSGIYFSYSLSSGSRSLKIEPYLIAPANKGNYVEVGHNNAYGATHWGHRCHERFKPPVSDVQREPAAAACDVPYLSQTSHVRSATFLTRAVHLLRLQLQSCSSAHPLCQTLRLHRPRGILETER